MCEVQKKCFRTLFFKRNHFIMGDLKIFGGWRLKKKYIYAFGRCLFLKQFGVYSKTSTLFIPDDKVMQEKYVI